MNQDWRSPAFRDEIRNKIANAMQGLGDPPQTHPPSHMEEQMFNRSRSAEEYRTFVDKLLKLLHQRRLQQQQQMGNQGPRGPIGQAGVQPGMVGPGQGPTLGTNQPRPDSGPIGPLQMLARQVGQPGTAPNQQGMMNNPNNAAQNMGSTSGGGPQQQFTNTMNQNAGGAGGPGGMMMVNQPGNAMMTSNQGQMMPGSAPGGPGQPVIPGGMAVGPPRGPMNSNAATMNAQQQQQLLQSQQRMNQQRLAMQRAIAAQQQQQPPQQQQQQQTVPISQAGMGNQPGMMSGAPTHPQSMQARHPFQGGPGVQGGGGSAGGGGAVMGVPAVGTVGAQGGNVNPMPTVSPSPTSNQMSNNQIIRSPANYNHLLPSPTGGSTYQNIHSPASNNFQGPPSVGSASVGPPSVDRAYSAPSPGNPMSTPRQQMVPSPAAPQPGQELDYQCQQKLHELASTYMEPLKRWIQMRENVLAGPNNEGKMMGGEEDQKEQKELKKMKSLLDILANKLPPKIPVNLSLLQKCEAVLQKILNHAQNQPKPSFPTIARPPSVPLKDQILGQSLVDAVVDSLKRPHGSGSSGSGRCPSTSINHALSKSFGPAVESLLGPLASVPKPPLAKKIKMDEEASLELRRKARGAGAANVPRALQGEIARLPSRFRVKRDPASHSASNDLRLLCTLDDVKLPSVPAISVAVPYDYPASSPAWDTDKSGRLETTPFLKEAKKNFSDRLVKMSDLHSLSSLLDTWEMSVRSTCATHG